MKLRPCHARATIIIPNPVAHAQYCWPFLTIGSVIGTPAIVFASTDILSLCTYQSIASPYPSTGKRCGFDLILIPKHAPDQGDLIYINFTNNGAKMYSPKGGAFDPRICSRGRGN